MFYFIETIGVFLTKRIIVNIIRVSFKAYKWGMIQLLVTTMVINLPTKFPPPKKKTLV